MSVSICPDFLRYPPDLPIVAQRRSIVQAIRDYQVVIVAGETGSGKSTQLPKMCLEAGRGKAGLIACTQPRRIAAVSLATRVADELGETCGQSIGYKIRFHSRMSDETVVKYMTDGVLLAEAQRDGNLKAYDAILIDEAHERSLNIDFLLGILQRLLPRRSELKVIITSATLDTEKFTASFPDAPVIDVPGRIFPVEVIHQPEENKGEDEATYIERAVEAVINIRRQDVIGDVLVFMPTERDIKETKVLLQGRMRQGKTDAPLILSLFGRMSRVEQQRIFSPAKVQKIIIATNIAETSLTVPGIRYVVDSGLVRTMLYNPRAKTTKMPVLPISQASADQRKGRCGRVGPGVCIRLFSEDDFKNRPPFSTPEILRSNLAEVILRMLDLRLGDPKKFPFLDMPSVRAFRDGYALLAELGAIDKRGMLTKKGRIMARLPLDPRIAAMILAAREENALREVTVVAAALSIQDPRVRTSGREIEADTAHELFADHASDYLTLFKLWETYQNVLGKIGSRSRARKFCRANFISYQRMREWEDIHGQISALLAREKGFVLNRRPAGPDNIHRAILSGNLRFIGLRKNKNIYQGGQGREIMIFPGSVQFNRAGKWIMAAELVETSRLFARTTATIKPEWIEPIAGPLCRSSYHSPHWEKRRGQVVALENVTLFGLLIVANRRVNFGLLDPEQARDIFIQSALLDGELHGSFDFLRHNQELVERLSNIEDRVRQRDILVDDSALFQFYEQRLPMEVYDTATLSGLLAGQPDAFLKMKEEDVVLCLPDEKHLKLFPEKFAMGDMELELSYSFEPGGQMDGVSVHIPAGRLSEVNVEKFEWLVPGLLQEKVLVLLRGMPKKYRRQLIPLPQKVEEIVRNLNIYSGSLYQALEVLLKSLYDVQIDPRVWSKIELSEHLRMCLVLKDAKEKVIKTSRIFADLMLEKSAFQPPTGQYDLLRKEWERNGIVDWDFEGLPAVFAMRNDQGKIVSHCYPALTPDGDGAVAIQLCSSRTEQKEKTREGLTLLYSLQFSKQLKQAKRDFTLKKINWSLLEAIGSPEIMDGKLWRMILADIFTVSSGEIPDKETFVRQVDLVKKAGFFAKGKEIMELVSGALLARRQTFEWIDRFSGKRGGDPKFAAFKARVREIIPDNFLSSFERGRLTEVPRYLQALRIRVERAVHSPAKDAFKELQIAPHEKNLARLIELPELPGALKEGFAEYRKMIEEFRISLFAQEMKTAFPISSKRLEKKWHELERLAIPAGDNPEKK